MNFDSLTQQALLGTVRSPSVPPLSSDDATLQTAIATAQADGAPEDQLLAAAAILSAYERCGAVPAPAAAAPLAPAPADRQPSCSATAAALLEQILARPNTPSKQSLAQEWIAAATRVGRRVPHALLPILLDYAAASRAMREPIQPLLDERGQWLVSHNPRWRFAARDEEAVESLWINGLREQRTAALKRLREIDPDKGRQLIQSTWKEDIAEERAGFVEALRVGLSPADEPFLESALEDRSKQVRTAAAELLSTLPGSALVARMIARLEPLIAFHPKGAAGLLRSAKPARIEVQLPPDAFDPAWARDGILETPPGRMGKRQAWLLQMLSAVPPAYWARKWGLDAAQCLAAATGDHAKLMIEAWTKAAERQGDASWLEALLLDALQGKRGQPKLGSLKPLPAERQRAILVQLLPMKMETSALVEVFHSIDCQLDPPLDAAAIKAVEQQLGTTTQYNYTLPAILEPLAHRLPPGSCQSLLQRWTGPAWEVNRKALDAFFLILQTRQRIVTEFAL
jgi:hypothetical protein